MFASLLDALLSAILLSLVSLVGLFVLSMREGLLRQGLRFIVALAAGTLFGDALIHLLPEAFAETSEPLYVSLSVLLGIVAFFAFEKFLHWHHHHTTPQGEQAETHEEHAPGTIHP